MVIARKNVYQHTHLYLMSPIEKRVKDFSSSPKLQCFYLTIELRVRVFCEQIENKGEKRKSLVYFNNENVNSFCARHHYVNTLCLFCVSIHSRSHSPFRFS